MKKIISRILSYRRLALSYGLVLAVSVLAGLVLLMLAFCLPVGPIRANVRASVDMLVQETDYFSVTPGITGTMLDNYSEAIYLNGAMVGGVDSLVAAALSGYIYVTPTGSPPVEQLRELFVPEGTGGVAINPSSVRFWNGWQVVLKPLLVFTDYAGVRQINLVAHTLLLFLLLVLMRRRGLERYAPAFLLTYLFMNPVTMALCMTYAGFVYCILIPCILMLAFHEKLLQGHRYLLFFELTGICAFYFNLSRCICQLCHQRIPGRGV